MYLSFGHVGRLAPIGLLLAQMMLGGCVTVGPDYQAPDLDTPAEYGEKIEVEMDSVAPPPLPEWWSVFDEPALDLLIFEARKNNHDLRIAVARIYEFRALLGIAKGERFPSASTSASAQRTDPGNSGAGTGSVGNYTVQGSVSWEVDLFGRIRRSVEAAQASLAATEAERAAVLQAITAETTRLYLLARSAAEQLRQTEQILASQREALDVNITRRKYGIDSDLQVAQAERVVAASESQLPQVRIRLAQSRHALAVLLGRSPGDLSLEFPDEPVPMPRVNLEIGVPADLLRRRPDVLRAERGLAAQTARIGVATADLYPSLSLSGFLGLSSLNAGDLFDADAFAWQVAAPLRWQIFSGGRVRQRIAAEEFRTEQALAQYEQTVLGAIREVEDAVVSYRESIKRAESLARSAEVAQRTLDLSRTLYLDGLSDYLATLDAERAVFSGVSDAVAARGDAATSLVELFRALGGGWDPEMESEEGR